MSAATSEVMCGAPIEPRSICAADRAERHSAMKCGPRCRRKVDKAIFPNNLFMNKLRHARFDSGGMQCAFRKSRYFMHQSEERSRADPRGTGWCSALKPHRRRRAHAQPVASITRWVRCRNRIGQRFVYLERSASSLIRGATSRAIVTVDDDMEVFAHPTLGVTPLKRKID